MMTLPTESGGVLVQTVSEFCECVKPGHAALLWIKDEHCHNLSGEVCHQRIVGKQAAAIFLRWLNIEIVIPDSGNPQSLMPDKNFRHDGILSPDQ